jgi:multidrug efflux pump subunit AcrA (membrane-fusion protein)
MEPKSIVKINDAKVICKRICSAYNSPSFPAKCVRAYESRLGFRVGGKIVTRKVDVGTLVKRGQVLMQLDPQDLRLSQAQAQAGLRAAETNRDWPRPS